MYKESKTKKGFTLIEILVVLAILGILAIVALVLVNPTERQAQARDAGRISNVSTIGRIMEAYYASKYNYPAVATWAQDLITSAEINTFPAGIVYNAYAVTNCTTYVQPAVNPTYCYNEDIANGNGILVYAKSESSGYNNRCTTPGEAAYFVYSSADGRGGTICAGVEPVPWAAGTQAYAD